LDKLLQDQSSSANRAVYVLTDLRQHDWPAGEERGEVGSKEAQSAVEGMRKLSDRVQACYLIDAGNEQIGNLMVTGIQADGPIVSGVRSALDVTVMNQGSSAVRNVGVKLIVEDGLPAQESIERLSPGELAAVRFYSTFTCDQDSTADEEAGS